jgi:predicted RNase H-like HicB family nuclease
MNNNKVKYPFVIYPAEEGGYVAEIPALKGCLAQGETLKETLSELETVASLWIETAQMHGEILPNAEVEIERVKQKLAA